MPNPLFPVSFEDFSIPAPFYFLSHFHRDHLRGLKPGFAGGKIICTEITARYLSYFYQVSSDFLMPLPFEKPFELMEGWQGILYSANHSLGSAMMVLSRENLHYLYTGDFRYQPDAFKGFPFHLVFEKIWMDDTYLDFPHEFPSKSKAIEMIQERITGGDFEEVMIGTYQTGKEEIFITLSRNLSIRFHTSKDKLKYYRLAGLQEIFCPEKTGYSCYSMAYLRQVLSPEKTKNSLIVYPTGWTAGFSGHSAHVHTLQVPYSEHSSKTELLAFTSRLQSKAFFNLENRPLDKKIGLN